MAKLARLVANDRIYVDILYLQLDGVIRLYKYQFITRRAFLQGNDKNIRKCFWDV
jgi:hypothetical protein